MEIELKLLIRPEHIQSFKKHPLIRKYAQSPSIEQDQTDIYFDTPDQDLKRCGAGLRVRQAGNIWTQTLKAGENAGSGLHKRQEWESVVHGPEPDLHVLRKMISAHAACGELISSHKIAARLRPIFTATVRRTSWQLHLPAGDEIECVLDQGSINNLAYSAPISEIELELKSGNVLHIVDFALALLEKVPLRIGNQSKAARGYALNSQKECIAVSAKHLILSKGMTIHQAFEAIAENCLQQIQANAACLEQSNSLESLHQMRIGLRRLRSALELFQEMIAIPDELRQELDWLSEAISAARDWDVLATKTLESIKIDEVEGYFDVKIAALEKAAALHQVAAKAIDSDRYTHLILSLTRWLQSNDGRELLPRLKTKDRKKSLKIFSRNMLEHDRRRLRKRGRQLKNADARARHRLRIAAKKMRYDTEFFQSLYAPKASKEYVAALSVLQDSLGYLNDIAVGDELLMEIDRGQPELTRITGYIRGYLAARAAEEEPKVRKMWGKFKSAHLSK
ncbi:CHAD domain-containing protein [Herminiimonas aquatilis]|uniref:CHAD domain-containing protein n=1 Tax=Herminiimonas aquatilis TaxID=345342 RepID=A0ABW2J1W8_9BURK